MGQSVSLVGAWRDFLGCYNQAKRHALYKNMRAQLLNNSGVYSGYTRAQELAKTC